MKKIFSLLLLTFLVFGCSGQRIKTSIQSSEQDLLANEAFIRFGDTRLGNLQDSEKTKAMSLCHQDKESKGLDVLKDQFHKRKNKPLYWIHVGNCYFISGNYLKAEFYYDLADGKAKKKTMKALIANNKGVLFLKQRHYRTAVSNFRKSIKLDTKLYTPRLNLAQVHLQFGRTDKAIKLLKRLHKVNPNDVDVLASLASAYLFKKNYKLAEKFYLDLNPSYLTREDIALYYSVTLYHLGKHEQALSVISSQTTPKLINIKHGTRKLVVIIRQEMKDLEGKAVRQSIPKGKQERGRKVANTPK